MTNYHDKAMEHARLHDVYRAMDEAKMICQFEDRAEVVLLDDLKEEMSNVDADDQYVCKSHWFGLAPRKFERYLRTNGFELRKATKDEDRHERLVVVL